MRTLTFILTSAALLLAGFGCGPGEADLHRYREIGASPSVAAPTAPEAPPALQWTTPDGWTEQPGGGLRLAAFTVKRDGREGLCTLIALGDAAGSLTENVQRWLGQVGVEPPPAELSAFVGDLPPLVAEGGRQGVWIDLGRFTAHLGPEAPSILAAVFEQPRQTLFLKLTGPRALLAAEEDAFSALCRSLR